MDNQKIAQQIRDGEYFKQARSWYDIVYLNPLAERFFFLMIVVVAIAVFLMGIVAFLGLLPLKPERPFFMRVDNLVDEIPRIKPLKTRSSQTANEAVRDFFIRKYMDYREGYSEKSFNIARRFVGSYSASDVFQRYNQLVDPSNAQSPIRLYGKRAARQVAVQRIHYNRDNNPDQVTVDYVTYITGGEEIQKSFWTATIQFFYSDFQTNYETDPRTGDEVVKFTMPEFQVTGFSKRQKGGGQ